jgi:hypothetical protein
MDYTPQLTMTSGGYNVYAATRNCCETLSWCSAGYLKYEWGVKYESIVIDYLGNV